MTYPGDSKLSEDIRQRVESTFDQSLDLARQGKTQEALLGCEFVLRLDPLFEPARDFMQKLESGETGPGEEEASPDAEDGAGQELDLGSLAATRIDLRSEFEDLLDRRDFRTLLSLAQEHQDRVVADPELRGMAEAATERLEAEPYVRAFLDTAEKAQRGGNVEAAAAAVEKARALDPLHPSLPPPQHWPASGETNDRIAELLVEGQTALDRGDHQGAIDSWSRIFLIDIDHGEANARIEEARRRKAETERQIEEAFHEGVSLWELGSTDTAREQFEKVLSLDASHPGAKDYIRRMDARDVPDVPDVPDLGEASMPSGDAEIFAPPDDEPLSDDFEPVVEAPRAQEAPDRDEEPRPARPAAAARFGSQLRSNRRFLGLAGLGVLVLLAVFGWLYMKRDALFPNSDEGGPVAQIDALEQARKLAAAGQTKMAIAQLGRLPSDHPQFAEAQTLIAQWEAPLEETPQEPAGPSDLQLAQRDQLVELAREAKQNRENLIASRYYALAAKIAPYEDEDRLVQTEVEQRLAGLESQIELFEQGDWEFVLPDLWRLHRANLEDRDIVQLMVDSYYNLGVRDLQRGDMAAAAEKLERAVELDPLDAEVTRLLRFSEVYGSRPADLLYRIFVKYLPFR